MTDSTTPNPLLNFTNILNEALLGITAAISSIETVSADLIPSLSSLVQNLQSTAQSVQNTIDTANPPAPPQG